MTENGPLSIRVQQKRNTGKMAVRVVGGCRQSSNFRKKIILRSRPQLSTLDSLERPGGIQFPKGLLIKRELTMTFERVVSV